MATENVIDSAPPKPLTVGMNSWGDVAFQDLNFAGMFAQATANRLASLTHILAVCNQEIDGGFMTDALELANDLAYQLQQVTALLVSHGNESRGGAA